MRVICMIPVRSGSKRIPRKNIRFLDGKPLVAHAIEAAKKSRVFDEIIVNSEDEIFRLIAKEYGVSFYKRPEKYATDEATNDDFLYDFLKNNKCDYVVQLLCTSPFIESSTVRKFTNNLLEDEIDTLISVKHIQIECMMNDKPLNFNQKQHTKPSQSLDPIQAYSCSLMGYNASVYIRNYEENAGAYHGWNSYKSYYELKGFETVDIDNEEDFLLAEAICRMKSMDAVANKYYGDPPFVNTAYIAFLESMVNSEFKLMTIEKDVPSILKKDGVAHNNLSDSNRLIANIDAIIDANSKTESWSHRFVDTDSNSCTLISQMKGEGNRLHFHENWNEWWHIIQGSWKFTIEGDDHIAKQGDIVLIEKGKKHKIEALEDNSIRLAVSRSDVAHIYQS